MAMAVALTGDYNGTSRTPYHTTYPWETTWCFSPTVAPSAMTDARDHEPLRGAPDHAVESYGPKHDLFFQQRALGSTAADAAAADTTAPFAPAPSNSGLHEAAYFAAPKSAIFAVVSRWQTTMKPGKLADWRAAAAWCRRTSGRTPVDPRIVRHLRRRPADGPGPDGDGDGDMVSFQRLVSEQAARSDAAWSAEDEVNPRRRVILSDILLGVSRHCANYTLHDPLPGAWDRVLESGLVPSERALSTFLFVFHAGSRADRIGEVAAFHDGFYPRSEKYTTLRVKALLAAGDTEGAEVLLDDVAADGPEELRLRSYLPLLAATCDHNDAPRAVALLHKMMGSGSVYFEPPIFTLVVGALA
eukprot:CAMPEP_0194349284 /NCGR_PEP_ID=MMETSP0171-20130528/107003_1 /TAXON_ID=218684 /ORGANISM="Corethron pennatum, Strain L29A3" /LENGTH=357 /DNA_ID=CAMNT_0039116715 /DNA_START=123 /DNA_END=1196 /DNA_ORIENTATION=-